MVVSRKWGRKGRSRKKKLDWGEGEWNRSGIGVEERNGMKRRKREKELKRDERKQQR